MWSGRLLACAGRILSIPLALLPFSSAYAPLSDGSLRNLADIPGDVFDIYNKETGLLAPVLIPRVSGTEGNRQVQQFFLDFFAQQLPAWSVSTHNSTSKTPATGDRDVPFTNIIVTRDPPWATPGSVSYLTLAAHFDSKLTPEGFIGATDSAAPCAMILHAARQLDAALTAKWEAMQAAGVDEFEQAVGVQLLLLDGEEAFVSWTHTDSLYGARALAEDWATSDKEYGAMTTFTNRLGAISLFVLLDLLGAPQPAAQVPSYFRTTHWSYKNMAKIEERMRNLKLWESKSEKKFLHEADKDENAPGGRWLGGFVEDDHIPFMARGVEILHLITSPFPEVWHKMGDDGEHLDIPTVHDWAKVVTAFTAEWMELEGHIGKAKRQERQERQKQQQITEKSEL